MAIGTAKMIGYDLPENFRMPYLASSVAGFWHRWHITLSEWLRDYLYIPLGGNRKGGARTYANLMATMLLGGLWHGASWNFVVWGGMHGVALAVHRAYRTRWPGARMPQVIAVALTATFTILCWVPFRSADWSTTKSMFAALSGLGPGHNVWLPATLAWALALVVAGHAAAVMLESGGLRPLLTRLDATRELDPISGSYLVFGMRTVSGAFVVATALLAIYFFGAVNTSPFIYFQF
jgi:alginate O-acetyltransferase complex protein AlgI